MNDDRLNQSEIIYAFLNPRPEYYSRSKTLHARAISHGNVQEKDPFSKIGQALLNVSQTNTVEENRHNIPGTKDIYNTKIRSGKRNRTEEGTKLLNKKSAFTSSITSFFNDSNTIPSTTIQREQQLTPRLDKSLWNR